MSYTKRVNLPANKLHLFILILICALWNHDDICAQENDTLYQDEYLLLKKISDEVILHTSFLDTEEWGKVPCNGAVFIDSGKALVLDTPVNDTASTLLLRWLTDIAGYEVTAVIPTHFHADCIGGLRMFHEAGVPTHISMLTRELAGSELHDSLNIAFQDSIIVGLGNKEIYVRFYGEGHTRDNVVAYSPADRTLFGGCLIKAQGAGRGNLADANVAAWPHTVRRIMASYPNIRWVIPGHGKSGGIDLLQYTIDLFERE